jgi:hypothetical protein
MVRGGDESLHSRRGPFGGGPKPVGERRDAGRTEKLRFVFAWLSFYRGSIVLTADGDEEKNETNTDSFRVTIGCRDVLKLCQWVVARGGDVLSEVFSEIDIVFDVFLRER